MPKARAQQEPARPAQPVIQSTAELVKIDVSAFDRRGEFIGGLTKESFHVLDRGAEQPIVFFMPVEAAAQVLVLVETSPAVYLIHREHLAAAYALLDGLAGNDEVSLVTYDQAPHALLAFTPDKSQVAAALDRVQYTLGMGELNFFDSVSVVLDWLAPVEGKRAIVMLTTGLDSSPAARWDALVQKLRTQDVVLFSVALGGSLRHPPEKKKKAGKNAAKAPGQTEDSALEPENPLSFAKADEALNALAKITGGRAYFPKSAQDFAPMYREIASILRHEYVLGIVPAHDGQFHKLEVQLAGPNLSPSAATIKKAETRIYAREGYLAPGP